MFPALFRTRIYSEASASVPTVQACRQHNVQYEDHMLGCVADGVAKIDASVRKYTRRHSCSKMRTRLQSTTKKRIAYTYSLPAQNHLHKNQMKNMCAHLQSAELSCLRPGDPAKSCSV